MTNGHNHPPHCCCDWDPDNPIRRRCCPECPEHGELAQLAQPATPDPAESGAATIDEVALLVKAAGGRITIPRAMIEAFADTPWRIQRCEVASGIATVIQVAGPPDCSTCHAHHGQPHTEYCHAGGIVGADPRATS